MNIRAELEDISTVKKKLKIEVSAEDAGQEYRKAADEYQKYAQIPGFRRGKAPLALIKRRFAEDIRDEVIRKLVPESYDTALKQEKLSPLGKPSLENLDLQDGKPLTYEAVLEILPEIKLPDYKGLKVEIEDKSVTDADVQEQLERLREENAQLVSVEDRTTEPGDQVMIDLTGEFLDVEDEKAKSPVSEEGIIVYLGDEGTHEAFNKHLTGLNIGEEVTFEAGYPADYPEKNLAGHKLRFTAEVTDIKTKVLPELNDEFAKDLGSFESLKDLQDRIRKDLETQQERKREEAIHQALTTRMIDLAPFEVPEVLVEERVGDRLESVARRIASQGVDPSRANVNWKRVREEMRPEAEKDVRARLILDEVAGAEGIQITDSEVDAEVEKIAESMGQPLEKVRPYFSAEERQVSLMTELRRRRALDIIEKAAKITTK